MLHRTLPALLFVCLVPFTRTATAQDVDPDPAQFASWRAESYGRALGLEEKTVRRVAAELESGEVEVFELRRQIMELEARIDRAMEPRDAAVMNVLSKEEQRALRELIGMGWVPSSHPPVTEVRLPVPGADGHPAAKPSVPKVPPPNATME